MTAHIHTDELDFYKATVCEGMRKKTGTYWSEGSQHGSLSNCTNNQNQAIASPTAQCIRLDLILFLQIKSFFVYNTHNCLVNIANIMCTSPMYVFYYVTVIIEVLTSKTSRESERAVLGGLVC